MLAYMFRQIEFSICHYLSALISLLGAAPVSVVFYQYQVHYGLGIGAVSVSENTPQAGSEANAGAAESPTGGGTK